MRSKWVPVIDANMCSGCQECIYACGTNCLELVQGIAALTNPDRCGSDENCIAPCPSGAIEMQWVSISGDKNIGRWKD